MGLDEREKECLTIRIAYLISELVLLLSNDERPYDERMERHWEIEAEISKALMALVR